MHPPWDPLVRRVAEPQMGQVQPKGESAFGLRDDGILGTTDQDSRSKMPAAEDGT
jgi:hypothetical protein